MKRILLTLPLLCLSILLPGQIESAHPDTLLLTAIKNNDLSKVKSLVEAGANVNATDPYGAPFLMWAAYKGELPMVRYLVERGADYEKKGIISLGEEGYYGNLTVIATNEEKLDLLKYLIDELGISVNDNGLPPPNGEKGPPVTAIEPALLVWVTKYNGFDREREAMVDFLLSKGANLENRYFRPLLELYQEYKNHFHSNKFLSKKDSMLLRAIQKDDYDEVTKLILDGANPNSTDAQGTPVVMWAAYNASLPIVRLLIENGADITISGFIPTWGKGYCSNITTAATYGANLKTVMYLTDQLQFPLHAKGSDIGKLPAYNALDLILVSILSRKHPASNYIPLVDHLIKQKVESEYNLQGLGFFYRVTNQFRKGLSFYLNRLKDIESRENINYSYLGSTHLEVSSLYKLIGTPKLGLAHALKGLSCKRKHFVENQIDTLNGSFAVALSSVAGMLVEMGSYKQALPYYLAGYEIMDKLSEKDPNDHGAQYYRDEIRIRIAELYAKLDEDKKAYVHFSPVVERLLGYNSTKGNIFYELENYSEAIPYYHQEIKFKIQWGTPNALDNGNAYNRLGGLYEFNDSLIKATLNYSLSFQHAANQIQNTFNTFSEEEQLGLWGKIRAQFNDQQSFALRHPNIEEMQEYCYNGQLLTKGLLLGNQKKLLQKLRQTSDTALAATFFEWEQLEKTLALQYGMSVSDRQSNFANIESGANELESKLAEQSTIFAEANKAIIWREIQSELSTNETAIEFAHFPYFSNPHYSDSTMYCAYIVRPGYDHPEVVPLFEEKQLEQLLGANSTRRLDYIDQLYSPPLRGLQPDQQNKPSLYDLIWQPMADYLEGVDRIYFAPSGLLHRINISAIPIDEDKTLAEVAEWHNLGSTRQLVFEPDQSFEPNQLDALIYSGILYDMDSSAIASYNQSYALTEVTGESVLSLDYEDVATRGGEWHYLRSTEKEGTEIQQIIEHAGGQASLRTGYEATEESFKLINRNPSSPRILHLATHGYFFPDPELKNETTSESNRLPFELSEHPMIRSGLILAGANRVWKGDDPLEGFDDGVLTAYEVSQLDLSNTELVVLSACETGLGDIKGNEGVYGLQRAFKMAGAKYLIMSLWQVPDFQTKELMTTFYANWLDKKMPIPAAFQQAQQQMREKYQNPYFWAGFVLVE